MGTTLLLGQTSKSKDILNSKFGKELDFEFGLNFKGLQTFYKNPRNSPKLWLGMAYANIFFMTSLVYKNSMFLYKWHSTQLEKFEIFEFELGVALLPLQ
jgi:hypothetical protein